MAIPQSAAASPRPRAVDRIEAAMPAGPTSQVDDHNQVLPFDPEANDPFIALMEDWFSAAGFDWHPHRGFETVSLVLEGKLEHRDNAGGHGILGPGDVQWTTTGRGVMHAEVAHERKGVHMLQLWLNLPAKSKMVAPRYQDLRAADAPVLRESGVEARVFAGEVRGARGKAETIQPATMLTAAFETGARFAHEVPGDHTAFVYVTEGAVVIAGRRVRKGQLAWFEPAAPGLTTFEMVAEAPSHVAAWSGLPIRERVVARGPFVMNTPEQIVQTIRDYQAGKFGPIPAE